MATKRIDENPKITDTVLFDIKTYDNNDNLATPYKVDKVIIYYLTKDFTKGNQHQTSVEISDSFSVDSFYTSSQVVKVFGTDDYPAWLSTDTGNAVMENVGTGLFELYWNPSFTREGQYIICYTWTSLPGGTKASKYFHFTLDSDTHVTTSIPSHFTVPDKYYNLLTRYLPEHVKMKWAELDLTPDVLDKLNYAIGDTFTVLENLVNQIVDLQDGNVINEQLLLYLANNFNLVLRSDDPTLWRRQIKRAIPLFKKKGTEGGLREALAQAGVTVTGLRRLWQVVSPYTWQESFTVTDDQSEFELAKTPTDTLNYELYLRANDSNTYTTLSASDYSEIVFDSDQSIYILTWKGENAPVPIALSDGDIIKIVYIVNTIANPTLENYIRDLPLSDIRDEATVTYPPKNWNVKLISEDDPLFDTVIPTRNAFHDPVIFGQIRTEFPYSENIYNMDTYNGSVRNSTNPCHLSKTFIDECSSSISSKFDIDVDIEGLSSHRINEVEEIIREYVPFDAQVNTINFGGKITEIMPPQVERIEYLVKFKGQEIITLGQSLFNRVMEDGLTTSQVKRTMLATSSTAASNTGTGKNLAITLFAPGVRFDRNILAIDESDNLLEILSGPDTGEYSVTNADKTFVDIVQGDPDTISYPINESEFPFRLSNIIYSGTVDSITQDNVVKLSDENIGFRLSDVEPGWKIQVTNPLMYAGTYDIVNSYPDDSIEISGWSGSVDVNSVSYQLKTASSVNVGDPSSTGEISVFKRGKIDGGTDFVVEHQIKTGDYVQISTDQFRVIGIDGTDNIIVEGYDDGNVGSTSVKVLRRLVSSAIGYLGLRGMTLTTPVNHESGLSIANGANELGPLVEDNLFKENFLVLIGSTYYAIKEIDGSLITLNGPLLSWGLSGASIGYSIVHFEKTPVTIGGTTINFVDRRNGDFNTINIDTGMSMAMVATTLNQMNSSSGSQFEIQHQHENINIEIEWRD